MKMPRKPPNLFDKIFNIPNSRQKFELIRTEGKKTEAEGKYRQQGNNHISSKMTIF